MTFNKYFNEYEMREAKWLGISVEDLRYIKKHAIPKFNIENPVDRPLSDVVRLGGRRFVVDFFHDGTVSNVHKE